MDKGEWHRQITQQQQKIKREEQAKQSLQKQQAKQVSAERKKKRKLAAQQKKLAKEAAEAAQQAALVAGAEDITKANSSSKKLFKKEFKAEEQEATADAATSHKNEDGEQKTKRKRKNKTRNSSAANQEELQGEYYQEKTLQHKYKPKLNLAVAVSSDRNSGVDGELPAKRQKTLHNRQQNAPQKDNSHDNNNPLNFNSPITKLMSRASGLNNSPKVESCAKFEKEISGGQLVQGQSKSCSSNSSSTSPEFNLACMFNDAEQYNLYTSQLSAQLQELFQRNPLLAEYVQGLKQSHNISQQFNGNNGKHSSSMMVPPSPSLGNASYEHPQHLYQHQQQSPFQLQLNQQQQGNQQQQQLPFTPLMLASNSNSNLTAMIGNSGTGSSSANESETDLYLNSQLQLQSALMDSGFNGGSTASTPQFLITDVPIELQLQMQQAEMLNQQQQLQQQIQQQQQQQRSMSSLLTPMPSQSNNNNIIASNNITQQQQVTPTTTTSASPIQQQQQQQIMWPKKPAQALNYGTCDTSQLDDVLCYIAPQNVALASTSLSTYLQTAQAQAAQNMILQQQQQQHQIQEQQLQVQINPNIASTLPNSGSAVVALQGAGFANSNNLISYGSSAETLTASNGNVNNGGQGNNNGSSNNTSSSSAAGATTAAVPNAKATMTLEQAEKMQTQEEQEEYLQQAYEMLLVWLHSPTFPLKKIKEKYM